MLNIFVATEKGMACATLPDGEKVPPNTVWVDLLNPTEAEAVLVEEVIKAKLPTRDRMKAIEISSRLYSDEGARYMTATLLCGTETAEPKLTNVTFIITGATLVTMRYDEPRSFKLYADRLCGQKHGPASGEEVMMGLMGTIIDRAADVLENMAEDIDKVSTLVFRYEGQHALRKRNYKVMLRRIGQKEDLLSEARESLATISRLLVFLSGEIREEDQLRMVQTMVADVNSISDYAAYLANKVVFLLDALLGMVTIEQNDIIKLFSVMAVVLLPPTLVASVYGMNFEHMPELKWEYGYPMALWMMVAAAVLPYLVFKWKKWL